MPGSNGRRHRVLITGAGGPSAVSFMLALEGEPLDFYPGDIDPYAPGLYLVEPERRLILPRGDDPEFAGSLLELCREHRIDVLVPTVDFELLPLAAIRDELTAAGTALLLSPAAALEVCLDKWTLMELMEGIVPLPRSAPFDDLFDPADWSLPILVKPRRGSGSRGIRRIDRWHDLDGTERGDELLVQDHLPGPEYSLDVLATGAGEVRAVVPRERLKIDSGIAVTSRTLHDPRLQEVGRLAAERARITGVANVQVKEDAEGVPRLIEINPRFPGTMPLTVASGINMPRLALSDLLGDPIPAGELEFRDIAMTRYFEGLVIGVDELRDQEAAALNGVNAVAS